MALQNYYYSGQGSLIMATRNATTGAPEGFVRVGNIPELTVDIAITKVEHTESETGSRGTDLVIIKEKKGTFKFKMESLDTEQLVIGWYGSKATIAGGSITDEEVPFFAGTSMPLAHPKVSSVVVHDGATTPVNYTLGTDYTIDADNGMIVFPATGSTITGSCFVDYTYAGYTQVDAFVSAVPPERYLRFNGLNTVNDDLVIVDLFRAQFDPMTNFGLINEELGSGEMSGSLLLDPFITTGSKYFRQRRVSAA